MAGSQGRLPPHDRFSAAAPARALPAAGDVLSQQRRILRAAGRRVEPGGTAEACGLSTEERIREEREAACGRPSSVVLEMAGLMLDPDPGDELGQGSDAEHNKERPRLLLWNANTKKQWEAAVIRLRGRTESK